jgi:L-asparagine transporter-like permease
MIGGMDGWTLAALALAAIGAAAMVAGRWRVGMGEWARALVVSAVAMAISGAAWRAHGAPLETWFSGFFICAALHRLIEAAAHSRAQE